MSKHGTSSKLGAALVVVAVVAVGMALNRTHGAGTERHPDEVVSLQEAGAKPYKAGMALAEDEEVLTLTGTFEGGQPRAVGDEVRVKVTIGRKIIYNELVATSPWIWQLVVKLGTYVRLDVIQGVYWSPIGCMIHRDGSVFDHDERWGNATASCAYRG